MSLQCCLICASDEGIFLDIFSNGNNFRDNIETCLSLKTKKSDLSSTKICHKCAYELDQCSKFVKKYKKTQLENGKLYKKHGYCSLCMEPGRKGLIFDLVNENPLNNPQEKIHRLFNIDGNFSNLSICLDCRYNLDVLFDLKCILSDHSDHLKKVLSGEIKSPNMEKIKTNVVRRKTTSVKTSPTKFTKDSLSDMDSDTSSISENTSTRLRSNGSSSVSYKRECEECRAKIPIGDDMFRYHTSGLTVCKQCCLKMDPSDSNRGKRRKISTETKFCCVFLKDILTSSDNKPSTIEKDDHSDSVYTISDDSTIEEPQSASTKINAISKSKRKNNQNDSKLLKKPKNDAGLRKSSRTRASSVQNEKVERKFLRSSRARSVEVVRVIGSRQLPEKKNPSVTKSETNKPKSQKKTNELSKLNLSAEKNKKNVSNVMSRGRKRTRNKSNSSISSVEENRSSKTNKKISKLSHPKADSDSENSRPYTCNICHNDFDNRVEGLTHELTHSKSLEVVLKKVSITDNTDNKLMKNEPEQNDEISDVINDVNDKEKVDALSSELSKEPSVDKPCNKDGGNDLHSETQTADNTLEDCENHKTNTNSENVEKIIDEKNDNDSSNDKNDEKSNNNDSKQNNGSNNIKSNSENEKKTGENNDENKHETERDKNEQEDSLIVVDTCSNNDDINQENQEKDNTNDHNNATSIDSNVNDSICESEEKTNEDNEKADEESSEKDTETTSNVMCDDENPVNAEMGEEDKEEEEEANKKIVPITNNVGEDDNEKVNNNSNDNDDNSDDDSEKEKEKEKDKDKEKKEKDKDKEEMEKDKNKEEMEKDKNKEEMEKDKDEEEKGKDKDEEEKEKDKDETEKESKKLEDDEESLQCSHDESTKDSLINNKNEASLNKEKNTVDDKNKDEEQLADKTVENDKNFNCSGKNEKKNITDDEDEGALIEKEMEKIKNHINNSKQVDQVDVDLGNNVELEESSNDNKSVSELNVTNSENREEP